MIRVASFCVLTVAACGGSNGQPQPRIPVGVTTRSSGYGHFANNSGKNLSPFRVLSPFMTLDSRPVTMSPHGPLRSAMLPRPVFLEVRSCEVVQVTQRLEGCQLREGGGWELIRNR